MAWVGSPAQLKMSLFLGYQFQRKSVVMSMKKHGRTVTRDMASSDWTNWRLFLCFPRKAYPKINQFVTLLGQGCKVID